MAIICWIQKYIFVFQFSYILSCLSYFQVIEQPLESVPMHAGKNTVTYEARLIKSLLLQLEREQLNWSHVLRYFNHIAFTNIAEGTDKSLRLRDGFTKNAAVLQDFVQMRGGKGPAQILCHLFINAFLANKRNLLPPKCQYFEL